MPKPSPSSISAPMVISDSWPDFTFLIHYGWILIAIFVVYRIIVEIISRRSDNVDHKRQVFLWSTIIGTFLWGGIFSIALISTGLDLNNSALIAGIITFSILSSAIKSILETRFCDNCKKQLNYEKISKRNSCCSYCGSPLRDFL
ncbi:hypothetical protein [Anabaena sp. UHCC 0204]|uniref:hypothetical protein n=1 Tax=Anabaena sp. UHCC 0204 TaxID=2590009 RepID=UPI0014463BCA|nr:hypothetical protein [Anabaena sp. UHCC 0204]MTJ09969.1 hypothetical protein [Anabaena sp. UHCC 0204]